MSDRAQDTIVFKQWFDAVWLGDGEHGSVPQSVAEPDYKRYMDNYTLAHGAWLEALSIERERNVALQADNAQLRDSMRWIPVSERLPEDDVSVLITDGVESIGHARHRTSWRTTSWWQIVASNDEVSESDVTHWMPLPTLPTDHQKGDTHV